MKEWMQLGEAARTLGVSESTMRRYGDSGRVRQRVLPSGHRRLWRADVESLLVTTTAGFGMVPFSGGES